MLKGLKYVIGEHKGSWSRINKLAINEIKVQAKGTTLGYFWTLYKDILYFIAYGFFITVVFGSADIEGMPKMVYLVTGLFPWYFISDSLTGGASSIKKRGGILTKIKFPISIIPTYEVLSIFYKRLASWSIILIVLLMNNMLLGVNWFLVIYYTICMVVFMTVFAQFISGFLAISKDFTELYMSFVRILFFFVPVMWSFSVFGSPDSIFEIFIYYFLRMNPLVYIILGFRDAFVFNSLPDLVYTIYFWLITLSVFAVGSTIQYKLRKVYADFL